MISKEATLLLETKPVAIATCVLDRPNVSVAVYLKIQPDGRVIITDNYMAKTVSNIRKNSYIELAVWGDDQIGFKISGKATYEDAGKWVEYVKSLPENTGLPAKGAIIVTIDIIKKIGD